MATRGLVYDSFVAIVNSQPTHIDEGGILGPMRGGASARLRIAAATLGVAWGIALVGPAAGAEPAGVTFAEDGPVDLGLHNPSATQDPTAISFTVVNGSLSNGVTISWALPTLPAGEATLPVGTLQAVGAGCTLSAVDPAKRTSVLGTLTSATGTVCPLRLAVEPGHGIGKYSTTLIVTATDGSSDRLAVTIEVAAPADAADPNAVVLGKPLPDTVTLDAEVLSPTATNPTVRIDPSAAKAVTTLIGTDGTLVPARLEKGVLSVPTLPGPGTYSGALADADDKSVAKVVLNVRHGLLAPFLIALAGVIAGFMGQRWVTRVRPRWEFEARLAEFAKQAQLETADEQTWVSDLSHPWAGDRTALTIYVARSGMPATGLLGTAIEAARSAFAGYADADARDKAYGVDGTGTLALREILKNVSELRRLGRTANSEYLTLDEVMSEYAPREERFGQSVWPTEASAALSGGVVQDSFDYDQRKKSRTDLGVAAGTAVETLGRLARGSAMQAPEDLVNAALDLLASMTAWDDSSWKVVTDAVSAALAAVPPVSRPIPFEGLRFGAQSSFPGAAVAYTVPEISERASEPDGWRLLAAKWIKWIAGKFRPAWLLDRYHAGEGLYLLFVLFIAIVTALNTNYFPKVAFGTAADYATLFIATAAATTILDLAKTIWTTRLGSLPA